MSHIVHKYLIPIQDEFSLMLPVNAKILKVDTQKDIPMIWVLHTSDSKVIEPRLFRIYGTGREIHNVENLIHIGSFFMYGHQLVWHLFEEKEDSSLIKEVSETQTNNTKSE